MFSALGSIGIFLALSSALVYGGADFVGGLATRRSSQYQVLALSSLAGVFLMIVFAFIWGEDWPPLKAFWWATLAGLAGALGLAVLYYGLSCGQAAIVSPVSGVLSAVLPVIFAAVTDSLPTPVQLAGFILAVPAIWLVSAGQPGQEARTKSGVVLGLLAGVAFGFFFILISQVEGEAIFGPLALAKAASCLEALLILRVKRIPPPSLSGNRMAILAGLLDPLANALFLLASRFTRLDVAVVLTSLYPAGTVLLSRIVLKERITRRQWLGVALCLAAILFITQKR